MAPEATVTHCVIHREALVAKLGVRKKEEPDDERDLLNLKATRQDVVKMFDSVMSSPKIPVSSKSSVKKWKALFSPANFCSGPMSDA